MGHTPILGPARKWSSSGLMLSGGRDSPLRQTMKHYDVDLSLCGKVHAITCIQRDGIPQISHGGLIGYNTRTNYLVGRVSRDRIELELKEIDMQPVLGDIAEFWVIGASSVCGVCGKCLAHEEIRVDDACARRIYRR